MGVRAWRNVVLDMALLAGVSDAKHWAITQYQQASCMTERLGALNRRWRMVCPKTEWLVFTNAFIMMHW